MSFSNRSFPYAFHGIVFAILFFFFLIAGSVNVVISTIGTYMDIVIHNPQSTIRTYFVRLSIDNWRLEKRFCLCVKKIRRNRDDERVSIRRNANCVYFFAGSEEFTKGIYESIGKSSSFVARKQEIRETIKALAKADCSMPEGV